jgi:hypothetical protein
LADGGRRGGICPKLTDAELLTLRVLQALGGFVSDARFLRHARVHLSAAFPYLPGQSGYKAREEHSCKNWR